MNETTPASVSDLAQKFNLHYVEQDTGFCLIIGAKLNDATPPAKVQRINALPVKTNHVGVQVFEIHQKKSSGISEWQSIQMPVMPRTPIYRNVGATPATVHSRLNKQLASRLARVGTSRALLPAGSKWRVLAPGNRS